MFELRPYQKSIVDSAIRHLKSSADPVVIDACVASGKTLIIAHLAGHVLSKGGKVISLAHTMELIEGAIKTFDSFCGVCAASIGRKEYNERMTFASEQTLKNCLHKFDKIDLLIIDESHRVNDNNIKSSYMKIIKYFQSLNPKLRIIGLTGTPYRLQSGKTSLIVGKNRLFKKIIDRVFIKDLLELGFATKPITPHDNNDFYDFSKIKMKMGKYQDKDLNEITHDERLTKTIVNDIIEQSINRNKVLIFASTLQHAKEILSYLPGGECGYIDGKLSKVDRKNTLHNFHYGNIKYLVNKDVLTTGYDFPEIDCVAILRPTESRALVIQIIGRGLRLHESKKDCLILDYAKNFNDITDLLQNEGIESIKPKDKGDQKLIICPDCGTFCGEHARRCTCGFWFISKICPECDCENDITARHCISCETELVDPNNALFELPSGASAFRSKVLAVSLSSHTKNKKCLRIDRLVDDRLNGSPTISQFIPEQSGLFAKWKKEHIKEGFDLDSYPNVESILRYQKDFELEKIIVYKKQKGTKYFEIVNEW